MKMNNCITDVEGILVGQVSDKESLTGCTVILCPDGATCSMVIRGGGPGSRESGILDPQMTNEKVHAVFLSGGSSYGLGVGDGVMQYLEEKDIGFDTDFGKIPIVPGAVIFDLNVGNPKVRPNREMGYQACQKASGQKIEEGNAGAGTGATIGKVFGFEKVMKGGIGSASVICENGVTVGVIVVVNSFGDIRDYKTGKILAGPLENGIPQNTIDVMCKLTDTTYSYNMDNTTLAVVATNVDLTKSQCQKLASMATNGLALSVIPYGTTLDGDTVFALSNGTQKCDLNTLGVLASKALSEAVINAIVNADEVAGIPAYKTINIK